MYCTDCGEQLRETDKYCSQCGNPMAGGVRRLQPPPTPQPQVLMLDKGRKKISGVCAGFARYFGMDVSWMRLIWLAVSVCTGVGFVFYLAAAIVLPSDRDYVPAPPVPQRY